MTGWPSPGPQGVDSLAEAPSGISTVEYAMVYQAEKPRLVRYLIQYGANWHDADDVAQRALTALYEQWEAVQHPRSWLRKVAFRELLRVNVTNRCSLRDQDQLDTMPDRPNSDRSGIDSLVQEDAVLSAIRQLPPLQRQVFALHFDQFSAREISEILSITEPAVRQNLARARARLKCLIGLAPE